MQSIPGMSLPWHGPAAGAPITSGLASGSLLLGQTQLVDHLLAHHEFLDLAGHGHREALDEPDIAGDLVVGDLALAEIQHFLLGQADAVMHQNPGAELFAEPVVRYAEDLDIADFRVGIKELLDL